MQLEKKVVVITGAARGIGRAMALAFAERGADVAALDRDAATLDETRVACESEAFARAAMSWTSPRKRRSSRASMPWSRTSGASTCS